MVRGAQQDVDEAIAVVVADIKAGRARRRCDDPVVDAYLTSRAQSAQPVVNATGVYRATLEKACTVGVNMYDDYPSVVSPWDDALMAYVNEHNNVIVMQVHQEAWDDSRRWDTDNTVDWGRVRWLVEATLWVGGRESDGRPVGRPYGPLRVMQNAVYDDGSPADMHWVSLAGRLGDEHLWEVPTVVLSAALNFLSCSNVEVAEPNRPFPVRQRIRKTRVQVQTIVVRPPGKRRAAAGSPVRGVDAFDEPLTSVRGSFATYGRDGGGLLFGKYAGKFWRPAHARGKGEQGDPKTYVLKP